MKKISLTIIGFVMALMAYAQEISKELVTDRPDQTESSATVPKHSIQIESGFIYEYDKMNGMATKYYGINSTLLRYGLLDNLELRIGTGYSNVKNEASIKGFEPLYLGAKVFITKEKSWVPELAILANIVAPGFAEKAFKPQYMGSGIRFAASHTLTDFLSLGYNLGAKWDGDNPFATGIYSLVFGFSLTEKFSAFIESYGYLPQANKPDHRADAGFTYLVTSNFQLDCSGGIGLMEHSPDYFINFGFSWRLPR